MSKRTDILSNIETTLNNLATITTVIMHQPYAVDIETVTLPVASVWTISESESAFTSGLVGMETWDWLIGIEVWFNPQSTDEETLIKSVNDALYVDTQRGGCAIDTKRVSIDHFEVYNDRDTNIRGFALQFRIVYYHDNGVL